MEMNKTNMIPEEALDAVAGGAGSSYYPYNNGDLVLCYVGSGHSFGSYQPGRVRCYADDEEGPLYCVEMALETAGKLNFTGEERRFRVSQLKPYNV